MRRNFKVQGSRSLTDTAGSVVVRTMARAEEAHVDTLIGRGNATKMGADTNDDGEFILCGEAIKISLRILQGREGSILKSLTLSIRALVKEDGLTTPDDGLALLVVHGSDFNFNVRFEDKSHLGLTHPPDGGDGVTSSESGEADEGGVEDVVEDASTVFVLKSGLRLEDVGTEEFFVEHGTGPGGQISRAVLAFNAGVGSTFRVGVEDDFLGSVNLSEGRVGELTKTAVFVNHFLGAGRITELITEGLNDTIILGDVFEVLLLAKAPSDRRNGGDAGRAEDVQGRSATTEHCIFLFFLKFVCCVFICKYIYKKKEHCVLFVNIVKYGGGKFFFVSINLEFKVSSFRFNRKRTTLKKSKESRFFFFSK